MTTLNIPLVIDEGVEFLVFERETGEVFDEVSGWECALNYVSESPEMIVIAVAGNEYRSMAELQAMVSGEEILQADCFGRTVQTLEH